MSKLFKYTFLFFILCLVFGFSPQREPSLCFSAGEKLSYRVHYGMINAGEAKIEIYDKLFMVNEKVCYKAVCTGRTTGAFDLMMRVKDSWGTYVDTTTQLPQKGFRDIQEGKYRLKEYSYFDYKNNAVTVDREQGKKSSAVFKITPYVQDIVSGFYYLRNIEYKKMKVGDTINIDAFLEDKLYDFKVKFHGRGNVKTKFGEIKCLKLSPIMDKNNLFEDGNSIRFWMTDDENKIPIRIEADMFVGQVAMDLKDYKGLKYPIEFK